MNVAVMKTKAEQGFAEQFERAAPKLPGDAAVKAARASAIGRFSALGLPHRRIEEWKYTDLRAAVKEALPLAIGDDAEFSVADLDAALGPLAGIDAHRITFVNGRYRADLSSPSAQQGVKVETLAQAPRKTAKAALESAADSDAIAALNAAMATDGAIIDIAKGAEVAQPMLIVFVRAGEKAELTAVRNAITVDEGASAMVIEAHVRAPRTVREGQINALTSVSVGDKARLAHVKVAVDDSRPLHLSNTFVALGSKAAYRGFQYTSGQGIARNQTHVLFSGEETKLDFSGAFLARGTSHIDTTLVVDHAVPRCESRELFKGVLEDDARGVFQGKIIVRPDAQKTDGKQMAQALMLSPTAEFDSKPELEIYADDVVCGHGTTSAQLDDDMLFYCKSRGIPEAEARALLIESFVGEALDKVEHEGTRHALSQFANEWLRGSAS